ncbi:uncharacterized protein [Malus domestica]|uniref:uncharacterized protein isoform X2 n=1 Tax=Malus domestica TaxID=3750 RepID=UPI003976B0DD
MVTMVELEEQGPAMRVLGSLFKLTEVFLWDDGSRETKDRSFPWAGTKPAGDGGGGDECGILQEDMELTKQMNALELPVSFNTNKKRGTERRKKKKGNAPEATGLFSGRCTWSNGVFQTDVTKCQCSSGQGDSPASLIEMNCDAVKAQNHDEISGIVCNDGQDCDPLNSGLAPNDTVEVAASPTDLDHGICPRGCSTDAAVGNDKTESSEKLIEHNHFECSLVTCHEAELTKTC